MQKQCSCGSWMNIHLRTVIYSTKVEIENVPIFSCKECNRSEVFSAVKSELTGLIDKLGSQPGKQQFSFPEFSELAHLMHKVSDKEHVNIPVETIIGERINELLDLLLLAGSLDDEQWKDDIHKRLSQIASHSFST